MHTMYTTLVLLMTAAAAAAGGEETDPSAAEPKRCCTATRYTTKAVQIGQRVEYGLGVPMHGYQSMVYDYDAKLLYTETKHEDPSTNDTVKVKVLQDFNNSKQYVIQDDGSCFYQVMADTPMADPCVSDQATFVGSGTLGFGSSAMSVNTWAVSEGHVITHVAFEADTCTPVLYSILGNVYGVDQTVTYIYYDFQPDVTDTNKLLIPGNCQSQWKTEL